MKNSSPPSATPSTLPVCSGVVVTIPAPGPPRPAQARDDRPDQRAHPEALAQSRDQQHRRQLPADESAAGRGDRGRGAEQPERGDRIADAQHVTPEERHQARRQQGGDEEADGIRRVNRPGMQRREAEPDLEVDSQQQQEARVGGHEKHRDRHAAREAALSKQLEAQERRSAARRKSAFVGEEQCTRRSRQNEADQHPQRPTAVAAFEQRHGEQRQ